jgi:hypothetical protein
MSGNELLARIAWFLEILDSGDLAEDPLVTLEIGARLAQIG